MKWDDDLLNQYSRVYDRIAWHHSLTLDSPFYTAKEKTMGKIRDETGTMRFMDDCTATGMKSMNDYLNDMRDRNREQDPTGLDQHSPGAKLDAGKSRPYLVLGDFAKAIQEVVDNGTFGANKYSDSGWKQVPNAKNRYMDAALRHLWKWQLGETRDEESNSHHLGAVAWNILAVLQLELEKERGNEYRD